MKEWIERFFKGVVLLVPLITVYILYVIFQTWELENAVKSLFHKVDWI